ncbi:hypothetical protein ACI6QG_14400 [Roseococcus sp. DSY-14]|uniref:hypothetical protein n=1 Tax=Roseococcus sp. DSY-14 TaxID=3369650 RepID=UPI00387B9535
MTAPDPALPEEVLVLLRQGRAGAAAAALEAALRGGRLPLARGAAWLVAAATLLAQQSRLLLPADAPAAVPPRPGSSLARAQAARLADWLEARPQLGRERFARGRPEAGTPPAEADFTDLLAGLLCAMEPRPAPPWRPRPPPLWQPRQALAHLRGVLPALPGPRPLAALLPRAPGASALQRRAAQASGFVAALELARRGEATLLQEKTFSLMALAPTMARRRIS